MVTVSPPEVVTPPVLVSPPETSVQSALAMPRNSYTPAISAPMKHRSMKETKMADRRVDLRRSKVVKAQAAARTETMNNTLRSGQYTKHKTSRGQSLGVQYVVRCELIGINVAIHEISLEF